MSTATEIEAALRELPLQEAQAIADWLKKYLDENRLRASTSPEISKLLQQPNYAARRRAILGNKVLPNLILNSREQDRW